MLKFHRHGGMYFFRVGRFGGSFYVAKAKPAAVAAIAVPVVPVVVAGVPQYKYNPLARLERIWRARKPVEYQTAVFGIR